MKAGDKMKNDLINDLKSIQQIVFDAQKLSGRALALLDNGDADSVKMTRVLDELSGRFEKSTIDLRNLCEKVRPNVEIGIRKPPLPTIKIAGSARVNEHGWVHIELNALLPHCRFQSAEYVTDTIARLLDEYEHRGRDIAPRPLPRFNRAIMVIDEHCDIDARTIYDQDNKLRQEVA